MTYTIITETNTKTAERQDVIIMDLKVNFYSGCKYDKTSERIAEHIYNDVMKLEIKVMTDEEIFADGYDEVDEHKEYAIMTFADGTTSTFRNSHVDIFNV